MFQLKFWLKTFQTCLLLSVFVVKCSILAFILFTSSLIRSKCRGWGRRRQRWYRGAKKIPGDSCPLLPAPMIQLVKDALQFFAVKYNFFLFYNLYNFFVLFCGNYVRCMQ